MDASTDPRPRDDERTLLWEGFYNARDLGGMPTTDGGRTRTGQIVRSADLRFATEQGLLDAQAHGIGTVLDLRNDFETHAEPKNENEARSNAHRVPAAPEAELPEGMFGVRVPMDNTTDLDFWQRMREEGRLGSPRFFRPVLEEHPQRVVEVLRTINRAPGGVIVHCAVGRDRTGLTAFTLLALADVEPRAIVDDYIRSTQGLRPFFDRLDYPDPSDIIDQNLAANGFTLETAVEEQLDGFDARRALLNAGMSEDEVNALRARLRGED